MADWKPTAPEDKFEVQRLAQDGRWRSCEFTDLRKGDMVRFFDGEIPVHPLTGEPIDEPDKLKAVCVGDPFKNRGLEASLGEEIGYCVELDVMEGGGGN